jgi:hypothetical protein
MPKAGEESTPHWFSTRPTSLLAALFSHPPSAAFALPRPDALSPLPAARHRAGFCVSGHQHIIPDDTSIPSPASLAYRGDADFHAVVNFRFAEVSEVRIQRILGSSGAEVLRSSPSNPRS